MKKLTIWLVKFKYIAGCGRVKYDKKGEVRIATESEQSPTFEKCQAFIFHALGSKKRESGEQFEVGMITDISTDGEVLINLEVRL